MSDSTYALAQAIIEGRHFSTSIAELSGFPAIPLDEAIELALELGVYREALELIIKLGPCFDAKGTRHKQINEIARTALGRP